MDKLNLTKLQPVQIELFEKAFSETTSEAFRLEILQEFRIPKETEEIREYLSGTSAPPVGSNSDWHDIISSATKRGVKHLRIRIVIPPVSDYLKYETAWGYVGNINAGEEIRVITAESFDCFETRVPIFRDFWLFDDKLGFLLSYDILGRFIGVHKIPMNFVATYSVLKNEAIAKSKDILESELQNFMPKQ